jgi:hypothetical protein
MPGGAGHRAGRYYTAIAAATSSTDRLDDRDIDQLGRTIELTRGHSQASRGSVDQFPVDLLQRPARLAGLAGAGECGAPAVRVLCREMTCRAVERIGEVRERLGRRAVAPLDDRGLVIEPAPDP